MIDQTTHVSPVPVDSSDPLPVAVPRAASDASTISVPLIVESPCSTPVEQAITVGVPWPRGVLADDGVVSLTDPSGQRVPLQTTPLARWPDRSVKWLLIDFILDPVIAGWSVWTLASGQGEPLGGVRPERALVIEEVESHLVVRTGSASFTLDRQFLVPIDQAEIDGTPILDAARTQMVLIDARGRIRRPRIERSEFEARGPVRATVRFDGTFDGRRARLRFRARLSFFAGSP